MKNNDLIKGALIGTVIGGLMGIFLAPKAGSELQEDIIDGYNSLNEQTHQFADGFKEYANSFMDYLRGVEHKKTPNQLMVGGLAGVVLGAIAGLLLAPQAGNKLREKLSDEYDHMRDNAKDVLDDITNGKKNFEHKLDDWKDTFVTILDKFSGPKSRKQNGEHINNILDWADLGLRLYNTVQHRR